MLLIKKIQEHARHGSISDNRTLKEHARIIELDGTDTISDFANRLNGMEIEEDSKTSNKIDFGNGRSTGSWKKEDNSQVDGKVTMINSSPMEGGYQLSQLVEKTEIQDEITNRIENRINRTMTIQIKHQGETINRIEDNVFNALDNIESGREKLITYLNRIKSNRGIILKLFVFCCIFDEGRMFNYSSVQTRGPEYCEFLIRNYNNRHGQSGEVCCCGACFR
eukprot:GHVP01012420.1.p1 GENE.GHVP01012420.1~~GHVP01012420.1.p1  ORF type:complete len:222 (+),score=26.35 GHVP01012420.1:1027-1692(+)